MLLHRFAIADPSQKFEEHHQTTKRGHRPLGLAQFHFLPAPKSGNFPMHCFVLLGVSLHQMKHYRVTWEQCYLISGFRLRQVRACGAPERALLHQSSDTGPFTVDTRITAGPFPNSMRFTSSSQVFRPSEQTEAWHWNGPCPSDSTSTPD